ncbi:hypothetical protein FHG87_024640, partial [Trinorchestia longiramus]
PQTEPPPPPSSSENHHHHHNHHNNQPSSTTNHQIYHKNNHRGNHNPKVNHYDLDGNYLDGSKTLDRFQNWATTIYNNNNHNNNNNNNKARPTGRSRYFLPVDTSSSVSVHGRGFIDHVYGR